jgi:hypothetical protein
VWNRIITIKKAKIWYSVDSNCHRRCLVQHKSRKIGGFFKVNCGAMDGDLRRLKKLLEAKWLIYVILKGIGKVSNRFCKFSFLMVIGWGHYKWKKRWRQNVPLENCRWSHLAFNPNILMLIPFIYRYLSIIYREGLAINHPWTQ